MNSQLQAELADRCAALDNYRTWIAANLDHPHALLALDQLEGDVAELRAAVVADA